MGDGTTKILFNEFEIKDKRWAGAVTGGETNITF